MTSAVATLLGMVSVLSVQVGESPPAASPAPDEPLLVVVERGHGAAVSPEAIRRAIADELKRPVVGPTDAAAKTATRLLVVTLASDSVAMQMRTVGDTATRRRIQPVAAGESNLRVVAWLAGNLARDQASELMDALPAEASAAARGAASTAAEAPSPMPTEPPPLAPAPLAPAVIATNPPSSDAGAAPEIGSRWRLGLSVGVLGAIWQGGVESTGFQRLELLSPSRPGEWAWNASLDVVGSSSFSNAYVVSGGINRRTLLVPGWLAADVAWGGGGLLSRHEVRLGDSSTTETDGPYIAVHAAGTLALVRFQFVEFVAGVRITEVLERWKVPWFGFAGGLRIALP